MSCSRRIFPWDSLLLEEGDCPERCDEDGGVGIWGTDVAAG